MKSRSEAAPDWSGVPGSVREIARVIGLSQALTLAGRLPRVPSKPWLAYVYVPARLKLDHPLVAILGFADALKLSGVFAGEILQISTCSGVERKFRDRTIAALNAQGLGRQEIAERLNVSIYVVRRALNKTRICTKRASGQTS